MVHGNMEEKLYMQTQLRSNKQANLDKKRQNILHCTSIRKKEERKKMNKQKTKRNYTNSSNNNNNSNANIGRSNSNSSNKW